MVRPTSETTIRSIKASGSEKQICADKRSGDPASCTRLIDDQTPVQATPRHPLLPSQPVSSARTFSFNHGFVPDKRATVVSRNESDHEQGGVACAVVHSSRYSDSH